MEVILGSNFISSISFRDSSVSVFAQFPKHESSQEETPTMRLSFHTVFVDFQFLQKNFHILHHVSVTIQNHIRWFSTPSRLARIIMIKGKPMTEDVPVETFTGLYTESETNNIKYQSNVLMHVFRDLSL